MPDAEVAPTDRHPHRWPALTGAAFAVLFAAGAVLYGSGAGASQLDITSYFANPGNQLQQIGGFALVLLAALCLLVYLAVSTAILASGDQLWRRLALASGVVSITFLMAANALWAATAFTVQIQGSSYTVSADSHLLVEDAGFVMLVTSMAAAIPWVLVLGIVGWRRGVLPLWFAALSVLAALGQAGAYWYFPAAGFLLWVFAGSALIANRRQR